MGKVFARCAYNKVMVNVCEISSIKRASNIIGIDILHSWYGLTWTSYNLGMGNCHNFICLETGSNLRWLINCTT